jgi:thiamine-monophosphate kinase
MTEFPDEFDWIDRLRPLTRGDRRALGLLDDVAVVPARPGADLVISKDAMVEGVHFLVGECADIVARRLLRTSISDLAAKAAEPFGYFLMTAWPDARPWSDRESFIDGLRDDGESFGLALLGGDTVRTTGPLTLSATVLGWAPAGGAILRSGARPGDIAVACGYIGDGWLGLKAALGEIPDATGKLAAHYRLPEPMVMLRPALAALARAAADVSDGLIADALHVAEASGLGLDLNLDDMPVSAEAADWCARQADVGAARLALATGGDDYAVICAVDPADADRLIAWTASLGVSSGRVGVFISAPGLTITLAGRPLRSDRRGYRH